MTQIDFYVLPAHSRQDSQRLACTLTHKAWSQQHQVYINAPIEDQVQDLDNLLWTYRDTSFLPHECLTSTTPPETTVVVGYGEPPAWMDDVMINLAHPTPPCFKRFQRILEIVDAQPERRKQARERYRTYQKEGYKPHTHELK